MSIVGNAVGCYSPIGKTFIIEDESGNQITGVVTEQEVVFTATDNNVRTGLVYAGDNGISTGTNDIPAYHTSEGKRVISPGSVFSIPLSTGDRYDYTSLQCLICPFNTSMADSVAVEKVVIENGVYQTNSTYVESNVSIDDTTKSIMLGITNNTSKTYLIRYFTYKEV